MTTSRLVRIVGAALRQRRELHGLTQHGLAKRAGTSQATVARIERGDRSASLGILERLFAALDTQLSVGVEPLDAHLDARIAQLTDRPIAERVADTSLEEVTEWLGDLPHLLTGRAAALVQGAPVPVDRVEIALPWSAAGPFTERLTASFAQRWHARWETFGYLSLDPREPGDHRWQLGIGEIQATMVDELPESIEVRYAARSYRVVPLAQVEISDPTVADLLRRWARQRQGQHPCSSTETHG